MRKNKISAEKLGKTALTVLFSIISIVYILPVIAVALNSFKLNTFVKTHTFDPFIGGAYPFVYVDGGVVYRP